MSASEGVDGDIVVLAVPYSEAPHVVREYSEQLGGRIVIDPTNPVDFRLVQPLDGAWIAPFQSGGQLIAAETRNDAAFVKAFNTNFAGPLLAGQVGGEPLDVFIAGDDQEAKAKVAQLVSSGGMRPIDAGHLRARESWRRPPCCTWRFRAPGTPVSSQRSRSYPDRDRASRCRSATRPTATGPAG